MSSQGALDPCRARARNEPRNDSGFGQQEKFTIVFQHMGDCRGYGFRIRTVKRSERDALDKRSALERDALHHPSHIPRRTTLPHRSFEHGIVQLKTYTFSGLFSHLSRQKSGAGSQLQHAIPWIDRIEEKIFSKTIPGPRETIDRSDHAIQGAENTVPHRESLDDVYREHDQVLQKRRSLHLFFSYAEVASRSRPPPSLRLVGGGIAHPHLRSEASIGAAPAIR